MANPPIRETAPGASPSSSDLEREISRLKDDLATLKEQISATGSHSYDAAKTAAQEGVDALKTNARVLEDQVVATVQEKPLTALAAAAAFGYLFAMLNRR